MILILGANGQLGKCLQDVLPLGSYKALDRKAVDFSSPMAVRAQLDAQLPWLTKSMVTDKELKGSQITAVINCVAYTDVARAEAEIEAAFNVNCHSVRELARWCRDNKLPLIHISTDYAAEEPAPANIYGQSKLAGEKAIEGTRELKFLIIRTSALFSEYATTSFLTKVIEKAKKKETIIMSRMLCQPTYAQDLALFIRRITEGLPFYFPPEAPLPNKIVNYCNDESVYFSDFAFNICAHANLPINIDFSQTTGDSIRPAHPNLKVEFEVPAYNYSLMHCIRRMKDLKLL